MTDTTHITKEGLLQAIEEIRRSEDSETVKAGLSVSAQDASPKDGYTGWLLEQEIEGVILYYRKTAFTEMPTRNAVEANLFHSQGFAQQVADRLDCGWLVREHAFVGASTK